MKTFVLIWGAASVIILVLFGSDLSPMMLWQPYTDWLNHTAPDWLPITVLMLSYLGLLVANAMIEREEYEHKKQTNGSS